jgi:hypothetical protein
MAKRKKMPSIIHKLRAWKTDNGNLSARQAATVMQARGFILSHRTMESWESGLRAPGRFTVQALERFLDEYPTVTDAPAYARYKISDKQVTEILAARDNGDTLLSIAQRFNISESSVSRICSGQRRKRLG